MSHKFRLIPSVDIAKLGRSYYIFDRSAEQRNIIFVPTQKISFTLYIVIQKIKKQWPTAEPQYIDTIKNIFNDNQDKDRVGKLLAAGYLELVPESIINQTISNSDLKIINDGTELASYFRQSAINHYFKKITFFNLPEKIPNADVDVGIIGVPVSSVSISNGTAHSPEQLRQQSQKAGFWFDFAKNGIYSEINCNGEQAELICKGVVLKDFGDIGKESRTVGELFNNISQLINDELLPNKIRPLFVGGDHAITFPIVDTLIKIHPNLVLLHFDAHNDLFYSEVLEYSHASPIQGLLMHSGLEQVFSFGLRTNGDPRVKAHNKISETENFAEKVNMYSIGSVRRRMNNPKEFIQHLLKKIDKNTPCYLSIDLDVLSESAMSGQLSTPAGHGLEYYELYEIVSMFLSTFNIIGADVVELNADTRDESSHALRETLVLLMQLSHGLASTSKPINKSTSPDKSYNDIETKPLNQSKKSTIQPNLNPKSISKQFPPATHNELFPLELTRKSIHSLSYNEFLTEFMIPGIPLVLTDCNEQKKVKEWQLEYFLERITKQNDIDVNIFSQPFNHQSTNLEKAKLWQTLADMRKRKKTKNHNFLSIIDWNFAFSNSELLDDYTIPKFFNMDISEQFGFKKDILKWIYFAEAGTGSPTHIDVANTNAWLLLTSGCKQWRFVQKSQRQFCQSNNQWVDLFNPDLKHYPEMKYVQGYEYTQQVGEIIWTPSKCLHAVRNIEASIAVTHNYIDLSNLADVYQAKGRNQNNEQKNLDQILQTAVDKLVNNGFQSSQNLLFEQLTTKLDRQQTELRCHDNEIENAIIAIRKKI